MHTFGKYATLTPKHNFVLIGHIFELGWNNIFNVEALMLILLYLSLAYFSPPSS